MLNTIALFALQCSTLNTLVAHSLYSFPTHHTLSHSQHSFVPLLMKISIWNFQGNNLEIFFNELFLGKVSWSYYADILFMVKIPLNIW